MKLWHLCIPCILSATLFADAPHYTLGYGWSLHESLTLGGYVSSEYETAEHESQFKIDDVALLAYGSLYPWMSYMVEFESVNFYVRDFENDTESSDRAFHAERVYIDLKYSDYAVVRIGKQITPVGYWNLEPINVLRDTTSSPFYAKEMFPRFLTGIDLGGYAFFGDETTYHLFGQQNRDMDEAYINIPNDHFFGFGLDHALDAQWSLGGGIGEFETLQNDLYRYAQAHLRYDAYPYKFQAEGIVRHLEDAPKPARQNSWALYAQGIYHMTFEHALVARLEAYEDDYRGAEDRVVLIGYSYRPVFPVSIKAEYQWHDDYHDNRFLTSFSVLF